MEGVSPDQGKIVAPGYYNAEPPGDPIFALSVPGSGGYAASIRLGGGEVTVDELGGINMAASSGAFVGVDTLANITITTSTTSGIILIKANGGGNNVHIDNAGTIAFDVLGAGALTGVQTINNQVYPPPGTGSASITQGGALVACLGNGAVYISSIGAGITADIVNAGTITFDTAGPGALVNVSTINGAPFPGSISSITNGGGTVSCSPFGDIQLTANGTANMYMMASSHPSIPDDIVISCAGDKPTLALQNPHRVLLTTGDPTIDNYIVMEADGSMFIEGSSVNINNVSTINGSAYPPPVVFPVDLTVSTLTAVDYVSTMVIQSISSITNYGGTIDMNANVINVLAPTATLGDGFGAGFQFTGAQSRVIGFNGLIVDANLSVSTITDISTINGVAYPPAGVYPPDVSFSTITMNTTGQISAQTIVNPSTDAGDLVISQENATGGLYLNVGVPQLGQLGIDQLGTALINYNAEGGITVNPPGNTLDFIQTSGLVSQGQITGLSTINGVAYIPGAGSVSYVLTGSTMAAVITTYPTGSGNPLTQNVFTNVTQITFNIPPNWTGTDSIYYDGWILYDFEANFNSFWGVNYYTNTATTPVDILGSTTTTANALNYSNIQQIYLPLNLIIPPTNLTAGGTITLTMYCNPTSINHYMTIAPVVNGRVGVALD